MDRRSIRWVFISRFIGLLFFILIVYLVNVWAKSIDDPMYQRLTAFLNEYFPIILVMTLLYFIGEIFEAVNYPYNLAYPLFKGGASYFLIYFLIGIFLLIDIVINGSIFSFLNSIKIALYILFPLFIIVIGYGKIYTELKKPVKPKKDSTKA